VSHPENRPRRNPNRRSQPYEASNHFEVIPLARWANGCS
jgi:hypothetical protein